MKRVEVYASRFTLQWGLLEICNGFPEPIEATPGMHESILGALFPLDQQAEFLEAVLGPPSDENDRSSILRVPFMIGW